MQALKDLNLTDDTVVKITTLINTHGELKELEKLDFLGIKVSLDSGSNFVAETSVDNNNLREGLKELTELMNDLKSLELENETAIDLRIVRGLDYYTGTVFEGALPEYPELGSIGGGGRYDNLASHYTDQKFPGVGASIGLSRLFYILSENNLIDLAESKSVDIAIIPIESSDYLSRHAAYELARKLRAQDKSVELVLTDKKLGDKLGFASKIARAGVIIGEDELSSGKYQIKDFATGRQEPLEI